MHTALLVIDVQQALCSGIYKAFESERVIERINAVSRKFRYAGAPVVMIQHESQGGPLDHGTDGWKLAEGLDVHATDISLRKRATDSFHQTNLHALLQARGVKNLVICGLQSEFCVDTTTRRALALGYPVVLVADGHSTLDNGVLSAAQISAHHNATLANITSFGPRAKAIPASEVRVEVAPQNADEVLRFWFEELTPAQWWRVDAALDARIRERFGTLNVSAAAGELHAWRTTPRGRLAELIVLDQFSRNIHRGTPQAFASDSLALALAQKAVAAGADAALPAAQRAFMYMPFMHSESRSVHEQSLQLFSAPGLEANHESAVKHKAIIDRFGRYPHRNEVLGRASTPEELAFLREPGSRF